MEIDLSNKDTFDSEPIKENKHNIDILKLNYNKLIEIPDIIIQLPKLTQLYISNNSITDISKLQSIPNLLILDASNNLISEIPVEFKKLRYLNCSYNQISHIPCDINKISELVILNLSDNRIVNIPKEFPKQIKEINLKNNKIKYVPPELQKLTNLTELILFDNLIEDISFNMSPDILYINYVPKKLDKPYTEDYNITRKTKNDGKLCKNPKLYKINLLESEKINNYIKKETKHKYTSDDINAISLYTSQQGYIILSYFTRNNFKLSPHLELYFKHNAEKLNQYESFGSNTNIYKYMNKYYNALLKCFKVKYDKHIILYRGLITKVDYKKGYIFESKTFTSTTTDISVAVHYSSEAEEHEPVQIIQYIVPAGTEVCPIFIVRNGEESEVLLNINSLFVVTSDKYKIKYEDKLIDCVNIVVCDKYL